MNDTEQLFIVAAAWTAIAAVLALFVKNWPGRVGLFVVLVGVPFWELPYGYLNFARLCRDQAKLLVSEQIPPQETVCADYPYVTLQTELLKAGFVSIEVRGKNGEVRSYKRNQDGKVLEAWQANVLSNYCMTFASNIRLPWRVLRHDVLIARADGSRVVARQSRFDWAGMWWQEEAKPLLGRGGSCFDSPDRPIKILRNGSG